MASIYLLNSKTIHINYTIGKKDGMVLRFSTQEDLPYIDQITIVCYVPIQETCMDDAYIHTRKAYEGVGFDRKFRIAYYWQNLEENKPESVPLDD